MTDTKGRLDIGPLIKAIRGIAERYVLTIRDEEVPHLEKYLGDHFEKLGDDYWVSEPQIGGHTKLLCNHEISQAAYAFIMGYRARAGKASRPLIREVETTNDWQ